MKRYNITTVGSYQKNGEEKKTYPQIGKLIQFEATSEKPESFILELNMFPNTRFCVFLDKPKVEETRQNAPSDDGAPDVDENGIPF